MQVTLHVPASLREFSDGAARLPVVLANVDSATLGQVFDCLRASHPGIAERALDERGAVRPHVNIFIDDQNSRFIGGLGAPVPDGSTILILPAVSGG
jgi:molybdopterin converting factor small subunit